MAVRSAILVVAAVAGAGALGVTSGAFSAQTVNAGSSFAAAESFCVGGTETVTASADSYVDGGLFARESNFGTATSLHVRSDALGSRRTLVRFTLPTTPSYCSVVGATLRLNATSASAGRTLQAFRAASAWTESGVTWSNVPGTTGAAATTSSGTGWREWDVTAHVEAMYSGSNDGFLVRDASEGAALAASQSFSSREASSNPPTLVVTFG